MASFEVFRPIVLGIGEAIVFAVMILTIRLRWEKVFLSWQEALRVSITRFDPSQIPPCPVAESKPAAIRSFSAGGAIAAPPVQTPLVEEDEVEVPSLEEQSASSLFDQVDPPPVEESLGLSPSAGSWDSAGSVSLEGTTPPWEDPGPEDEDDEDLFPDDYSLQPIESAAPVESPPDFSALSDPVPPPIVEPPAPPADDIFAPPVEEMPAPPADEGEYTLAPVAEFEEPAPPIDDIGIKPLETDELEIDIAPPVQDEPVGPAITMVDAESLDIAAPTGRPSLDPRGERPDDPPQRSAPQAAPIDPSAEPPLDLSPDAIDPPAGDLPDDQLVIPDDVDFSQPSFALESLDSGASVHFPDETTDEITPEEDDPLDELFK